MVSEFLLLLLVLDLEKLDCSNDMIVIVCEGIYLGFDGNVLGIYSLEYCFFCF